MTLQHRLFKHMAKGGGEAKRAVFGDADALGKAQRYGHAGGAGVDTIENSGSLVVRGRSETDATGNSNTTFGGSSTAATFGATTRSSERWRARQTTPEAPDAISSSSS